jgi:hypothetical protein
MTACLAAGGRYGTYGQLVGDLRRMFTNALAYNKKHLGFNKIYIFIFEYEYLN